MEEWVEYLKNGIINPETQAPGLQEAREKLKYYSMTNAERHAYDEHVNAIMIQTMFLAMQDWKVWKKEEPKAKSKAKPKKRIQ